MADKDLISLLQIHELDYWTHKFGCTRDQLREAVAAVGDSAKAVGEYLENGSILTIESQDVEFWTQKFACTPDELREAVATVGYRASAVGEYLARKASDAGRDGDSAG